MKQLTVDKNLAGKTVKEYFLSQGYSTRQIKNVKFDGYITVNGQPVTVRKVLKLGDVLCFEGTELLNTPSFSSQKAQLLFCDNYLYVAKSPTALPPTPTEPTTATRWATGWRQLSAKIFACVW